MNTQEAFLTVQEIPELKKMFPLFQFRNVNFLALRETDLIEEWLLVLKSSIQQGVLSNIYPEPLGICAYLEAFRPKRNFYTALGDEVLKVHWRSGIPILAEFTGIRERKENADHELSKNQYYENEEKEFLCFLAKSKLAPLFDLNVVLKKMRDNKHTFDIFLDRFDPVANKFVRYNVRMAQASLNKTHLNFESVTNIEVAPEFRKSLSVYSWLDSELVFYTLSELKDISIEMVSRSAVGPFYFGEYYYKNGNTLPEQPESVANILSSHPKSFWLTLPEDSVDINLSGTQNNDPFSLPLSEINPKAYKEVMRRSNSFGITYGVRRNSVFVVSKDIFNKVKAFCSERNCRVQIFVAEEI